MNTAQEHAVEQANLIAQLVKYADRLIVVESASPPERHDFVELVAERLPDSIEILAMAAEAGNFPREIIPLVTEALQLSPGIESPRQLASAVHEALTAQGRMLVIIENVNAWLDTESWPELLILLRAAHELAPNHLLFLLTGEIDLTEHLRAEPELADMQSDMHQCLLLDAAFADASPEATPEPARPATKATPHKESPKEEALIAHLKGEGEVPHFTNKPARRGFNPTLLIIAAFSVAVVSFGGFALLTRTASTDHADKSIPLQPAPSAETATPTAHSGQEPSAQIAAATPLAQPGNPLPNDGEAGKTAGGDAAPTPPGGNAPHLVPVPAPQPPATSAGETVTSHLPAIDTTQKAETAAEAPGLSKPAPEKPTPEKSTSDKHAVEKATVAKPTRETHKHTPIRPSTKPEKVAAADNTWYHAQPKSRATLQLGAFTDTQAALGFIRKHEASTHLTGWHIFTQKPKNQVLYTVTVGDFATLNEARAAIAKLPEPLRQVKPYPRTFNAIDQVLTK